MCLSASGAVLLNPGFETGTTTGWTLDGTITDPPSQHWFIVSSPVEEGKYCLLAEDWPKALSQSFTLQPVSYVTAFSFWTLVDVPAVTVAQINYSDGTSTAFSFKDTSSLWEQHDLLPYLSSGKFIDGIQVYTYNPASSSSPFSVNTFYDTFTLNVSSVPEPSTLLLLELGTVCFLGIQFLLNLQKRTPPK